MLPVVTASLGTQMQAWDLLDIMPLELTEASFKDVQPPSGQTAVCHSCQASRCRLHCRAHLAKTAEASHDV